MKGKEMKNIIFAVVLIFGGATVFSTCHLFREKGFIFDEETFVSNWNEWKNKDIQNYSFTMTGDLPYWSGELEMYNYEVNIVVKNGIMDSFEYIGDVPYERDGETVIEPQFSSISDMYQRISDSATEVKDWEEFSDGEIISAKFEIKYDSQFNYITFVEFVFKMKPYIKMDTYSSVVNIYNFSVLENE